MSSIAPNPNPRPAGAILADDSIGDGYRYGQLDRLPTRLFGPNGPRRAPLPNTTSATGRPSHSQYADCRCTLPIATSCTRLSSGTQLQTAFAYPAMARYNGWDDINNTVSWSCPTGHRRRLELSPTGCRGLEHEFPSRGGPSRKVMSDADLRAV